MLILTISVGFMLVITSEIGISGRMTFFQFLNASRGSALLEMLSLEGQPSPSKWSHHEEWWLVNRQKWLDKVRLDFHQVIIF